MVFRPTAVKGRLNDITPQFLEGLGVSAVLLDVDNTIASYTSHEPLPGTKEWAADMIDHGFRVIIVSNNYKRRVSSFAKKFGLDYISFALKPFPFGYLKARKRIGVRCKDCVIVGDQIFTDVVGANMIGMKSILLSPIEPEEGISFRLRRWGERPLRKKYSSSEDVLK